MLRRWKLLAIFLGLSLWLSACTAGPARETPTPPVSTQTPVPAESPQPAGTSPSSNTVRKGDCELVRGEAGPAGSTALLGPGPGIPVSGAVGERLVIEGWAVTQDCTPLEGAELTLWQTDAAGSYGPGHGSEEMQCCYYQGSVRTGPQGWFRFETIRPGAYAGETKPPPAHIHLEVRHPDAEMYPGEFVFAGDPALPPNPETSGYLVLDPQSAQDESGKYLFAETLLILTGKNKPEADSSTGSARGNRVFVIDPQESQVSYQIREKFADLPSKISAVGVSKAVSGEIQVDLSGAPKAAVELTADLRELRTDDPQRDEKLYDRWLVTRDFPFAKFSGSSIAGSPAQYVEGEQVQFQITGDLTIRDVTRPVTFEIRAKLAGDSIQGSGSARIRMTDFGIDPPNLLGFVVVEDEVLVEVDLTARENGS